MKIKPCPFCGGKAWAYSGSTYHFESGFGWICACKACDAQGEIGKTKAEAIRKWNRRDGKESIDGEGWGIVADAAAWMADHVVDGGETACGRYDG